MELPNVGNTASGRPELRCHGDKFPVLAATEVQMHREQPPNNCPVHFELFLGICYVLLLLPVASRKC